MDRLTFYQGTLGLAHGERGTFRHFTRLFVQGPVQ